MMMRQLVAYFIVIPTTCAFGLHQVDDLKNFPRWRQALEARRNETLKIRRLMTLPDWQHTPNEYDPSSWVRSKGIRLISMGLARTGSQSFVEALRLLGYKAAHGEIFNGGCGANVNTTLEKMWNSWDRQQLSTFRPLHESLVERGYDATTADRGIVEASIPLMMMYPQTHIVVLHHPGGEEGWLRSIGTFAGVKLTENATRMKRKEYMDSYNFYNWAVQNRSRVLHFNVKEGWGPLCAFLNVSVPDVPFPHIDDYYDGCRGVVRDLGVIQSTRQLWDDRRKLIENGYGEKLLPVPPRPKHAHRLRPVYLMELEKLRQMIRTSEVKKATSDLQPAKKLELGGLLPAEKNPPKVGGLLRMKKLELRKVIGGLPEKSESAI